MMIEPLLIMLVVFVLLPIGFLLCVAAPIYFSLWASLCWIYTPEDGKANPVAASPFEFELVTTQYQKLFEFWRQYYDVVSFADMTLPLLLPPVIGVLLSVVLSRQFIRYVRSIFSVDGID